METIKLNDYDIIRLNEGFSIVVTTEKRHVLITFNAGCKQNVNNRC